MENLTRKLVSYHDHDQHLEGYLVFPPSAHNLPGVLLVPTWLNVHQSICSRADRLAALGYAVFVADIFGAGIRPAPPQSPMAVVGPYLNDRLMFRRRLLAGLRTFESQPECSENRIAAVGYCLGGCGVLELARGGAPLRGIVSLHGLLSSPAPAQTIDHKTKILVLHGDADPLVPFDQLVAFREEMLSAHANWQIDIYGDARHSFTGEGVLDQKSPEAGLHPQSESRSWRSTVEFLEEVLE